MEKDAGLEYGCVQAVIIPKKPYDTYRDYSFEVCRATD
nr:MAG TPA: hypothetical protein [Caudoviricetes sp.]